MQKYTILRKKEYFCTLFTLRHIAMSCILNIETSTNVCSVAVSKDGECIFNREDHGGSNHAVQLGVYVDEAVKFADGNGISLDAVAVSCDRVLIRVCASAYQWQKASATVAICI